MMSIFVHNDCFGYMVLDFLQQLKTSLIGVEMSGESKWEGGGGGGDVWGLSRKILYSFQYLIM